jgi:LEA14-like dessication related protein
MPAPISAIRAFGAAVLLALAAGCSVLQLEPPRLQVTEVSLVGADLLKQQLRVRMRVHNPNDVELPVRGISYEVQVAGDTFANGESQRDIVVPALGATEFDVDVTANAAAALLRVLANRDRGDPDYRILGKVHLARGLIKSIPFEHSGTIRLR